MKSICLLLFSLTLAFNAYGKCKSEKALKSAGFVVHDSSQFDKLSSDVMAHFTLRTRLLTLDAKEVIYSSASREYRQVISWDDKETPTKIMYGDILFIRGWKTGTLLEIRWYENNKKHVVINTKNPNCPVNMIPWASNALY